MAAALKQYILVKHFFFAHKKEADNVLLSASCVAHLILRSHLLRACDTHEPALARKLRRHVAELLPYAIHRALVHRTIHTRLYRIMTAIVVAHRPALCRRALSVQVLHNLKPALRQAHRPAAVKRDCLQLRRESDSLLRGRITDVRMSRAAAAVSAGLHPRFFDSSLNATLIA